MHPFHPDSAICSSYPNNRKDSINCTTSEERARTKHPSTQTNCWNPHTSDPLHPSSGEARKVCPHTSPFPPQQSKGQRGMPAYFTLSTPTVLRPERYAHTPHLSTPAVERPERYAHIPHPLHPNSPKARKACPYTSPLHPSSGKAREARPQR